MKIRNRFFVFLMLFLMGVNMPALAETDAKQQSENARQYLEAYKVSHNYADLGQAINLYSQAAYQNEPRALWVLPVLYGLNSPFKNESLAVAWLQKAAYLEIPSDPVTHEAMAELVPDALHSLCELYERRAFLRQTNDRVLIAVISGQLNFDKARDCYIQQMRSGDYEGAYKLGYVYQYGFGTPRNRSKAVSYYTAIMAKAKYRGENSLAACELGFAYIDAHKWAQAYFWLTISQDGGCDVSDGVFPTNAVLHISGKALNQRIVRALAQAKAQLSSSDIALQNKAISEWRRQHLPEPPSPDIKTSPVLQ